MSKNYTQKTAALKTTTHETRSLDAQQIFIYPGEGDSTSRENILDIISKNDDTLQENIDKVVERVSKNENDIASNAAATSTVSTVVAANAQAIAENSNRIEGLQNTIYLDARGQQATEYDLWGTTITAEINPDTHIPTVTHNSMWVAGNAEKVDAYNALANGNVHYIKKNRAIWKVGEIGSETTVSVNIEADKVVYDNYCTWIPAASLFDDTKFNNLAVASNTQSKEIFNKTGKDVYKSHLPQLGYASRTWYKFSTSESNDNSASPSYKVPFIVYGSYPSLTIADQNFAHSNIVEFIGDYDALQIQSGEFMQNLDSNTSVSEDGSVQQKGMYSLEAFEGSLSRLLMGDNMFKNNSSLTSFQSNLNWLLSGNNMFENTQLDVDSVRNIANTLPVISTDFGVVTTTISTPTLFSESLSGVDYVDTTYSFDTTKGCTITITWNDLNLLDDGDKAIILYELFPIMEAKGWTIATNLTDSSFSAYELDGKYFNKVEVISDQLLKNESLATHRDNDGKLYYIMQSPFIMGNIGSWEYFRTLEAAVETWGLTEI